jgi:hypothetical protein
VSHTQDLCDRTIDHITNSLGLAVLHNDRLTSAMDGSDVGSHRVLGIEGGVHLVYVGMTVEQFGLDSHMLFAFTPTSSPVPHFTLDAVLAGTHYAFHLDLIPRVDPGANLAYLDHCFAPLTEAHDACLELDGLTPAHLSPRQWQLMSAWMLAHRADEPGFASITPTVDTYRDHWLALVSSGVPDSATGGATPELLAARDAANRAAIFSPEVDPVWARVDQLLGTEVSQGIQDSLRDASQGNV